jgi:hypothetical protein
MTRARRFGGCNKQRQTNKFMTGEWKELEARNSDIDVMFTVRETYISRHAMTSWFDDFTLAKWRDLR